MKRFLLVALAFFSFNTFAGIDHRSISDDFNNLPETTKLEIAKKIAEAKAATQPSLPGVVKAVESVTPEKIDQWAENGKGIGIAIGSAAKELGLAADAFLKTDAGKITVAMVAWKVMGRDVIRVIGGSAFFLVLVSIWVYIYRRTCLVGSVYETPVQLKVLGMEVIRYKKETIYDKRPADEEQFFLFATGITIMITSGIIIFVGL